MTDFAIFLRSLGLVPRAVVPDGKWRRCPTDSHPKKWNGAYKLAPDSRVGWAQDWATMTEPVTWRAERENVLPRPNPEALRRAWADAQRKAEAASRAAAAFYEACAPLRGGHPYLEAHGLGMDGCSGLKVDRQGWLVIPAQRADTVRSVQRIAPDGDKRFWPGAPIAGTSYCITHPNRRGTVTVLCEGLATGLACYAAAMTVQRVIVAWNAGNLARTPEHPGGLVVIAADNDHETEKRTGKNPGLEAARQAAETIGCGVAYPTGITGTDWADYRSERLEACRATAGRYDTRAMLQRTVDSEIARELMRNAKFVAPKAEGISADRRGMADGTTLDSTGRGVG